MFDKILIANRGEIACRIIETCRRLGIATVAVYSEADARARHVQMADEARLLGPALAAESYLDMDRVLAAAEATGAQAVHPGYGFLSENAEFARRCEAAGLVFIGPRPETIELMGSKSASKQHMAEAGVPVVPGYHGEDQNDETLATEAQRIGFPLMIKAVAGGGGKGMRVVPAADDFAEALAGARREARNAFGDDRVLLERFVEQPRHIEVQVFGDSQGNAVHLFERECSLQRRYQKVVEETPSPFLDAETRQKVTEAAVTAARAVNYLNAGTVEFIAGADRRFYFMEMNTRLQVEHPVTELTTGEDLVEWQLRVAAGDPLPRRQDEIRQQGHAIEVRLYAENPAQDFLPATGRVRRFVHPAESTHFRLDSGIRDNDEISIHYDPMIAKLSVFDRDRALAVRRLRETLARTEVFGPATNIALLRGIAADRNFDAGDFDTTFIGSHLDALLGTAADTPVEAILAAAIATLDVVLHEAASTDDPNSPWNIADGWRADGQSGVRLRFVPGNGEPVDVVASGTTQSAELRIDEQTWHAAARRMEDGCLNLTVDGRQMAVDVFREGFEYRVRIGDRMHALTRRMPYAPQRSSDSDEAHPGSPMPGRIVAVHVAEGDSVEPGQALLVLEGMKMEYTLKASVGGTVKRLLYGEGDMVDAEVPLVDIAPTD